MSLRGTLVLSLSKGSSLLVESGGLLREACPELAEGNALAMTYLWFLRRHVSLDRAIEQTGVDLFHRRLYFRRYLIGKVMEWSIGDGAHVIPAWKAAVPRALK